MNAATTLVTQREFALIVVAAYGTNNQLRFWQS